MLMVLIVTVLCVSFATWSGFCFGRAAGYARGYPEGFRDGKDFEHQYPRGEADHAH